MQQLGQSAEGLYSNHKAGSTNRDPVDSPKQADRAPILSRALPDQPLNALLE